MSDEIKDINEQEVTEEVNETQPAELESPLIVHKKGDASYKEVANAVQMSETHEEEEEPTLQRHRFRKERKSHKKSVVFLFVLVVLCAIFAALYLTGNITFGDKDVTTKKVATTESTTTLQQKYEGTIVVKDMYIFVDGEEVDGINGLQKALEYVDASPTAYKIIDENANADFLNYDVLELLTEMNFYGDETVIEHIASTGLVASAETTTAPTTTTAPATSTAKETTTEKKG